MSNSLYVALSGDIFLRVLGRWNENVVAACVSMFVSTKQSASCPDVELTVDQTVKTVNSVSAPSGLRTRPKWLKQFSPTQQVLRATTLVPSARCVSVRMSYVVFAMLTVFFCRSNKLTHISQKVHEPVHASHSKAESGNVRQPHRGLAENFKSHQACPSGEARSHLPRHTGTFELSCSWEPEA